MDNLMLDSCVVFEMKFWNNYANEFGYDRMMKFADKKLNEMNVLKNKISNSFPEEFLEKYKKYAFDEKVKQYKFFYNECKNNVRKYELLTSEKNLTVSPEKKEHYKALLKENKELFDKFVPYEIVIADLEKYHNMKNYVYAGQLYKGFCEGKYKFFVNHVTLSEVLNHTQGIGHSRTLFFTQPELFSFLSKITLVTTKSKDVIYYLEKLARAYRNPSKGSGMTPMSKDINSLNDWGDSKIIAMANLAGINLVTNNGKDFIFDKSIPRKNENIRNHIAYRNEKFSDFASSAKPYSPSEIIEGRYEKVVKPSKKIKLVKATKNKDLMFGETLELI